MQANNRLYIDNQDPRILKKMKTAAWFLILAVLVASFWSYAETVSFFEWIDSPEWTFWGFGLISNVLSLIFQFGQSPLFFLASISWRNYRNKHVMITSKGFATMEPERQEKVKYEKWTSLGSFVIYAVFFLIFCAVDAGTNLSEVGSREYETILHLWVMRVVAVALVFAEELIMKFYEIFLMIDDKLKETGSNSVKSLKSESAPGRFTSLRSEPQPPSSYRQPERVVPARTALNSIPRHVDNNSLKQDSMFQEREGHMVRPAPRTGLSGSHVTGRNVPTEMEE